MLDENSSNSDQNVDFEGLLKKVDYDGDILDSEQEQSQSKQVKKKVRRKNYSKKISSLLEAEQNQNDKTKLIKKNCISAKQSRQRKKLYIETLEKTAQDLKREIIKRKAKIASNRDAIMTAIKLSNPEKSRFISQYLEDNKNLAEQISKLSHPKQQQECIKQEKQGKHSKSHVNPQPQPVVSANNTEQHNNMLQNMINSYLYKFGFTGVLRRDVLQQLKMKWFELAIDENIVMNGRHNQLKMQHILQRFKNCMNELEKKGLELQYLFRNLQYNLSQEQIVKFIINPEFLITAQHNGAISRASQQLKQEHKDKQKQKESRVMHKVEQPGQN